MANQQHLEVFKQGVEIWNEWRPQHLDVVVSLDGINIKDEINWTHRLREANFTNIDFSWSNLGAIDLSGTDLRYVTFIRTNLQEANLSEANLEGAKLNGAFLDNATLRNTILQHADLSRADLRGANLQGADLRGAILQETILSDTYLKEVNLEGADLTRAMLVRTDLTKAILTNCSIYGISAWNVQLEGATQESLIITDYGEPVITVDNLEVAQFIYLLLNNPKIRDVIDTIAKKAVLILGRFTPERKQILDALRDELRKHDYLPILFDFEKPSSRNIAETVRTLAHLARFIIADLTDPSSIPRELQAIVPTLAVAVQPILLEGKREYAMFIDFLNTYHWMLPIYYYQDQTHLLASLHKSVIVPAERKANELEKR